jgi:hypothetical protein
MLRGWHGHNGVTLGNPRLGFVCTKQTMDGQPGLEGYYYEDDHALAPEERVRFSPGEEGPDFDPARAPRMEGADWPAHRLRKISRNFSMDFVRTMLPVLAETFGHAEAKYLGGVTAVLIGMQYYAETARLLGVERDGATDFADYLVRLGRALDDQVEAGRDGEDVVVRQHTWRLLRDVPLPPAAAFEAWNGVWEGALSVHSRRLTLEVRQRLDRGDPCFEWRIRPRRPAVSAPGS